MGAKLEFVGRIRFFQSIHLTWRTMQLEAGFQARNCHSYRVKSWCLMVIPVLMTCSFGSWCSSLLYKIMFIVGKTPGKHWKLAQPSKIVYFNQHPWWWVHAATILFSYVPSQFAQTCALQSGLNADCQFSSRDTSPILTNMFMWNHVYSLLI